MERSRTVLKPEKILFRQKFSVHTLDHTTLMIGIWPLKKFLFFLFFKNKIKKRNFFLAQKSGQNMEGLQTVFQPEKILFRQIFPVHTLDHATLMINGFVVESAGMLFSEHQSH